MQSSNIDHPLCTRTYSIRANLAFIHARLPPGSPITTFADLTNLTFNLRRRFRHAPNQANNERHNQHQQRSIDVERNLRRDPSGIKPVRNRLTGRLKRAETTSAARRLFDVGGECSQDPVELELGPVAGDEEDEVG